jgi:hypothetical protein
VIPKYPEVVEDVMLLFKHVKLRSEEYVCYCCRPCRALLISCHLSAVCAKSRMEGMAVKVPPGRI